MSSTIARRIGVSQLAVIAALLLTGLLVAQQSAEAQSSQTLSFVCSDRVGQLFIVGGTSTCPAGFTRVDLSGTSPAVTVCVTPVTNTVRIAGQPVPCMFFEQTVILHGPTETFACSSMPLNRSFRLRMLLADANGQCRSGSYRLVIPPGNPVAADDSYVTGFETPLIVPAPGVLANDASNSGTVVGFDAISSQGGIVSVAPDGGFTYTPPTSFVGTDTFGYTISNGTSASSATVTIEVMHFTVANDDEYVIDDTFTGSIPAPGVLGNDEVNGATITAYDAATTAGGTVVLNADGSFSYTPPAIEPASDTFTYTLTNPVGSSTATVTLNFNEPPVATNDDYTVDEDGVLSVATPGVLDNDTDPDGDPLSAVLVTDVTNGTLTLNADGSFTYTPDANFFGNDSFTYTAHDSQGGQSAAATVTITITPVNDPPDAVDDTFTVLEDSGLTTLDVLANDTIAPDTGETLTMSFPPNSPSGPGDETNNGTVVFYTTFSNQNGADSFVYIANDGNGGSDTATVSVTVTPVNDAPSFIKGADQTIVEDTPTTVNGWATSISPGPADETGQILTFEVVSSSDPSIIPTSGVSIDPATGNLTITPAANASGGPVTITIRLTDDGGTENGGADTSADQTFQVTVTGANDGPTASDQSVSTTEDLATTITLTGSDIDGDSLTFAIGTGPTNGSLGAIGTPTCAAGSCSATVTYTPDADTNGGDSFTFTVFDGSATSAPATISITVSPVADAPVANDDTYDTDGAATLNVPAPGVLGNDTDADGNTLTAVLVDDVSGGTLTFNADGSFSYTADSGTVSDSFTYMANDGQEDSNVATVTITINALPVADAQSVSTDEDVPLTITLAASDADDENLTFAIAAGPSNGSLGTISAADCTGVNTCSATVLYTPGTNFNGTDSFTFTVNDGHVNSAAATISITVDPINDAPIFNAGVDQTVLEDSGATTVDGWATAISPGPTVDEAGQTVTFGVTNDNNPLFSVQPDVDEATGDLTFTVAPNAFGSATVTVTLSDDGGTSNGGDDTSDSQTFTITVTAVNDAPSFTPGVTVTVTEDSAPYSAGWATAISAGPNESGQTLAFVIDSNNNSALFTAGGQPAIASNGTLTFTLAPDAFGTATLSVRLTDNGGTADGGVDTTTAVSLTITVNAANDAPTLAGGTTKSHDATAHLELTVTQNLLFDAADKANEVSAGSVLSARVANDPASAVLTDGTELTTTRGGKVIITATGFRYQPPAGVTGGAPDTAAYFICDTGFPAPGLCTQLTLSFTIGGELVWFINGSAGAGGTGTMFAPFNTIAAFNTYNAANAALTGGDVVFLYSGTYTNGITLVAGQRLFGQGAPVGTAFHTATGLAAPATGSAYPSIVGTAPNIDTASGAYAVTLNATTGNNTLRYLTLGTAAARAGAGITGTSFGTLTVGDVSIDTDGQALSLTSGTLAPVTGTNGFNTVNSIGGTNNVALASIATSAPFSFGTGALSGATSNGVMISQQNGTFTFAQTIQNSGSGAQAVSILNRTGGTVTFSGSINPTSPDTAAPTANSRGISISSSAGTYTFSGAQVKIASATLAGVSVTGGSATVEFTGGRLAIVTTTGNGISATAGTLRVTGANNTISSTGGIALNVNGAAIGTGGLSFISISANGGANGIVLNNTGSTAGLIVIGDGSGASNGSGGHIQNTTGSAIVLTSTRSISLTQLNVTNTGNHAININSVTNFIYQDASVIDGGDSNDEHPINILNLFGTSSFIEDVILDDINEDGIQIRQNATDDGATDSLTLRRLNVQDHKAGFGEAGIEIQTDLASMFSLLVDDSDFAINTNAVLGVAMSTAASHTGTLTVTVQNSVFNCANAFGMGSIQALGGGSGTANYVVTGNQVIGTKFDGIRINNDGTQTTNATVSNNSVTGSGATNNGEGITMRQDENGTLIALISNNTVSEFKASGIHIQAQDNTIDDAGLETSVTITGNNATVRSDGFGAGLLIDVGTGDGVSRNDVCANVTGNTLSGTGTAAFFDFDITLQLNETANASLRITQASEVALGTANNGADVSAFANPPNTIVYNGGTCSTP